VTYDAVAMMTAFGSTLPVPDYDREAVLLRSACQALLDSSADIISGIEVSLPVGDDEGKMADLRAFSLQVIRQYGMQADLDPTRAHLHVRISRPRPGSEGGSDDV
jgi:hypothetical protein